MKVTPELKRMASTFFIKKNILVEKSKANELRKYILDVVQMSEKVSKSTLLNMVNERAADRVLLMRVFDQIIPDVHIEDAGERSCDCVEMARLSVIGMLTEELETEIVGYDEDIVGEVEEEDVAVVVENEGGELEVHEIEGVKPKRKSRKKAEVKDASNSEAS